MKKQIAFLLAIGFIATTFSPAYATIDSKGISNVAPAYELERRKKRIKGGSGCDDPHDVIEHPECQ